MKNSDTVREEKILNTAVEAAKKAGNYLLEGFGYVRKIEEKGENDFVTERDIKSEKIIRNIIEKNFPGSNFISEEISPDIKKEHIIWIIDPIDGTKNYIHGFPFVCVSIACMIDGEVKVGIVYDFVRNDLFHSIKGKGSFKNKEKIKVSERKQLKGSMIATGFPFKCKRYLDIYLESFKKIFKVAGGVRRAGSAALDLCYTAMGKFDGFWEIGLSPWDVAAGSLILEEAGGRVSDFDGGRNFLWEGNIIGSSPHIYNEFFNMLNPVLGRGKLKKV